MIRQIVGRCHVSQSNLAVIRYVISRLKHGYKTWLTLDKAARKDLLREIIEAHAENKRLYEFAERGY
jgi:hypothetical protein